MPQFAFTDDEFLKLINAISEREVMAGVGFSPLTSMDDVVTRQNLDSLGVMLFSVWLAEMFEIKDDDLLTEFMKDPNFTVRDLREFVKTHQTKTFTYVEALEFGQ